MDQKRAWLLVFAVFLLLTPKSAALSGMLVSVSIDHSSAGSRELIKVYGKVSDESGSPIQNALVSIQVDNPNGSTVHVALVYSSKDGTFKDEFSLAMGSPEGTYTIYITSSKLGYEDYRTKISFTLLFPDFSLLVSPSSLKIERGGSADCAVTMISKASNLTVELQVSGFPSGVEGSLNPSFITPSRASKLTLKVSSSAEVGSYNLTVVGVGGGITRYAPLEIEVIEGESFGFNVYLASILAASLAAGLAASRFRKRRIEAREKRLDREYLAYARAVAKLEELKARGEIDEETYNRLCKEYEEKLGKRG
ncbi:TPA: hypothetical protein EYP26_00475 [Candidatus Bathyarchaeota archaeon]|nr:hypothetical protein [Candidatus Bathyarchaeota archaeon]